MIRGIPSVETMMIAPPCAGVLIGGTADAYDNDSVAFGMAFGGVTGLFWPVVIVGGVCYGAGKTLQKVWPKSNADRQGAQGF